MITIDRITETEPGEILGLLEKSGYQVISFNLSKAHDDGTTELLGAQLEKIDTTPKESVDTQSGQA